MELKYFRFYKRALKKYAKAIRLEILYKHQDSEGVYVPTRRYIIIDKDLEESDEIATLLHELGHAMDDQFKHEESYLRLSAAYGAIYTDNYTRNQVAIVLDCERRAWKFGRALAKTLKIPLGKWYTKFQRKCMDSYRDRRRVK